MLHGGKWLRRRRYHGHTVQQALLRARQQLAEAGVSTGDAKALIANAIQPRLVSSNDVFLWYDHQLRHEEADSLTRMVHRRCRGEPLAYVVGFKEFWSMEFRVTQDTLIPRSDSEVLIETLASLYTPGTSLRILDIGTGSGCLLLAAVSEYKNATGVGIDISRGALEVAQSNAQRLGLHERAVFMEFDMESLPALAGYEEARQLFQQFDVILCNPPYIPLSELPLIAPDVLQFEPHGALFSEGPNALRSGDSGEEDRQESDDPLGLRFYDAVSRSLANLLDPRSTVPHCVLLEVGSEPQARAVQELFQKKSLLSSGVFLFDAEQRYRGLLLQSGSV